MAFNNTNKKDWWNCLCFNKKGWRCGYFLNKKIGGGPIISDVWYIRPQQAQQYGSGNGTSYEHAFNGFSYVNWDNVKNGDTLYICGTHTAETSFTIPVSNLAIEGVECIIDSTSFTFSFANQSNLHFKDLTIDKFGYVGTGTETDITFENCTLTDSSGNAYFWLVTGNHRWTFIDSSMDGGAGGIVISAMDGAEGCHDFVIRGNSFLNITESADSHGIGVNSSKGWLIDDNIFDNTGSAILFWNMGSSYEMGNHIIRNNTITNVNSGAGGHGIAVYDVATPENPELLTYEVYGNTIDTTYGTGIVFSTYTEKSVQMYNNEIIDAGGAGIRLYIYPPLYLRGEVYQNIITNPSGDYMEIVNDDTYLNVHDNIEN